ncbi:MutH/Sau3AI family endonuclease [Halarcobacter sp.]|uniref:MutH/Sau3AI family endonuclease n=1 Tax=Halarcobacter sp. TaxID=2321133 RepID=UPI003A8EBAE8
MQYNENNKESILEYAKQLEGTTLREILPNEIIETMKKDEQGNKGRLGQKIERYFFGYECNSDTQPDFPCGLELKVTPLKVNKNGSISPKERLVCNIINYHNIINEKWETSSFLNKNKEMLIIKYIDPMNKDISQLDYEIVDVNIHNILEEDSEQFEKDWNIIVNKIREGRAHELSESDTLYLGACTKGATAATSLRTQPNSEILAKQRAFSFKTKYMKELLNRK